MQLADLSSLLAIVATVFGFAGGGWAVWRKYVTWKFSRDAGRLYVRLRKEAGANIYQAIWHFEPGSREFDLAEHLVAERKVVRRVMGATGSGPPAWSEDLTPDRKSILGIASARAWAARAEL